MGSYEITGVQSEAIERIGYDAERASLFVTFRGGGSYLYEDVPEELYLRFRDAESKGRFFAAHIRDRYDYAPLKRRR